MDLGIGMVGVIGRVALFRFGSYALLVEFYSLIWSFERRGGSVWIRW